MSLRRLFPSCPAPFLWALLLCFVWSCSSASASSAQRPALAAEWQSADLLRQRCSQAVDLMMNGPRFTADHGADAGRKLGIWMTPFFDLLAQVEQLQRTHPDPHWRETAGYCRLSINLAITEWHNGNSDHWFAPFLQSKHESPAASWQQHQWRKEYPGLWQKNYPAATKEEINAARLSFKRALQQDLPITLPKKCLEKTPLRTQQLSEQLAITVDFSEPSRYLSFMRSAYRSECRAFVYRAYQQRGGKAARKQLNRLLAARLSLATQMGYASWSHYRQRDALLERKQVRDFLTTLERALTVEVSTKTKQQFKPWDHWRHQAIAAKESPTKEIIPSGIIFNKQLLYWSKALGIRGKKVNLPIWQSHMAVWQLTDEEGLIFGEIYLDLSSPDPGLATSRLRYPVAGFQSGAMLISTNRSQPVTTSKVDSSILKAIYGILFHPTHPDFSSSPYPDLEGFEERLLNQITKPNSFTPPPPVKLLKRVLIAKLAYVYHQHNLSMTDLTSLNMRLLGDNRHLVDAPLASLPYAMLTLATADSLSYRALWQYALAKRIANRYQRGEITISDIMLALHQLRGATAQQSLIDLAALDQIDDPLASGLAKSLLRH
ncbi:hypothetical protein EZV61_17565 [Corallincola luteus]|uniref:Peptidase M3A/M3B catalytic domain-containing protein n=1 Tax=Corallincola luteus TaxID=1775177 RepID=A0ABY2AJJ1_9GAMM|nr:M3 family metallopeptidase [Corallincola luteus]TCI01523.1 hypothetical protein EZV61_17565 [Corallincola luteus]